MSSLLLCLNEFPVTLTITEDTKIKLSKTVWWKLSKIYINIPHNILIFNVDVQPYPS